MFLHGEPLQFKYFFSLDLFTEGNDREGQCSLLFVRQYVLITMLGGGFLPACSYLICKHRVCIRSYS